jgi:hypothetical protein
MPRLGLMEVFLEIKFAGLASRFDRGGFVLKCGIATVVLSFVAVYPAVAFSYINTCNDANERVSLLFKTGPNFNSCAEKRPETIPRRVLR